MITYMWGRGYTFTASSPLGTAVRHASPFCPFMFMAQEPQMPSRQERRKVSVGSCSFLIFMSTSSIMGPHSARFTAYVARKGAWPGASGFHRYTLKYLTPACGRRGAGRDL